MKYLAAIVAVAGLFAGQADAQSIGSHIKKRSDQRHSLDTRADNRGLLAVDDMTACYARERTVTARQILNLPFGSADQAELATGQIMGAELCMQPGYVMRTSNAVLISSLAENLAEQDLGQRRDGKVRAIDTAGLMAAQVEPKSAFETLGICLARHHPDAALSFLATEPGGKNEIPYLQHLAPVLQRCVPAGEQLEMDVRNLRATTAFGLYRLAQAADGNGTNERSE